MKVDKYYHMYSRKNDVVLEQVPAPEQHWIPIHERTPDHSGWYLATQIGIDDDYTWVGIKWYSSEHGWDGKGIPVAWMLLPEPWNGDGNA